jgi:hypothetical protein
MRPSAPCPQRRGTTHVETLRGELCIYEWTTKTVHALNPAAARVWDMCDGVTTTDEMIAAVRRDLNAPGATAIVEHALAQFDRAGLLEPGTPIVAGVLVSRRALLQRIGVAAAIPVVTSIVAPTPLAAQSGLPSQQFNFTGGPQSFVVPAGVHLLAIDAVGGSGASAPPSNPGLGGRVQATVLVTPGETLTIRVGGNGGPGDPGGFNGGAAGGAGAFGGGGASDVRRGSTMIVVAGGGGAGGPLGGGNGGAGGGLVGGTGAAVCGAGGGGGGTQSAGGAGGSAGSGGNAGSPGTSGNGGPGAPPSSGAFGVVGGSGGGGGYFGGGGGGCCSGVLTSAAAGGGGSSFTDSTATPVSHTPGFGGSARIILTWGFGLRKG